MRMRVHHFLSKLVSDGRYRTKAESDFHGASGRQRAICGHTEGADMRRPFHIFFVGNSIAASWEGEVFGKAGLQKSVWWRRGVDGVIILFIFPIAHYVREGPVVG